MKINLLIKECSEKLTQANSALHKIKLMNINYKKKLTKAELSLIGIE